MRRLGRAIGQCEALTPAPNVAEKNRIKAKGRLRFFGARAAKGGEAHTGLLGGVPPFLRSLFYIIYFLNLYFYIRVYAAAKPPGVASSNSSKNIF
jgi:hypothetical protein